MARTPQAAKTDNLPDTDTTPDQVPAPSNDTPAPQGDDTTEPNGDDSDDTNGDDDDDNGDKRRLTPEQRSARFAKKYGYKQEDETKAQAFKRHVDRRMSQTLSEIEKLKALTERNNYEYTDEQVEKILGALQAACQELADRFAGKVKGKVSFSV